MNRARICRVEAVRSEVSRGETVCALDDDPRRKNARFEQGFNLNPRLIDRLFEPYLSLHFELLSPNCYSN